MFSKRLWRLHTYLNLLALGILLPAVSLIAWNGYSQHVQADDAAKREVYNLANIAAESTSHFLFDAERLLQSLTARIQSRQTTSAACDPVFEQFKTLFPQFTNLSQSSPDGYIVCSSVRQPDNQKTFVGDTQWFRKVYEQNKFVVAQPYKGPVTGRMVSVLSYPIRDAEGKMTGSLQLPIDLVNYELMPGAAKLPKSIIVSVFDSTGVIIARSQAPEKFIGRNLRGVEAVEQFFRLKDGTVRSVSSEGIERIFGFRPIPGTDWLVVAGIATSEALKASRVTAQKNAVLACVGLALAVFIAFSISKQITKPITSLQDTAARVARGEYERRTLVQGPKEILDVASQFNAMLDSVETSRVQQAAREAEIYQLAFYDGLTGLPNRRLLVRKIDELSRATEANGQTGAILFIDLDHFKDINDAYGHQAGDRYLKAVAHRLGALLDRDDMLARIGGDEFVLVAAALGGSRDEAAAMALELGARVQQALRQPFDDDGYRTAASASLGITLFPKPGATSDILLHEADIAMYQVKQGGRNDVVLFEAPMREQLTLRLSMEADLQSAVNNDAFELHVQPQFDHAGTVTGAEALLRWQHPERGLVPPVIFIPLAERSNLIVQIGRWVLREGCKAQVAAQAVFPGVPLSINVSPRQFRHPDFVGDVRKAIAATGADPALLILELTEGVLIDDAEGTIARMNELARMGLRFSIDDFGTGYSSLSYLKRLPLYELKIDRSFTREVPGSPSDNGIVQSIVGVARHLGLHIVAEGVETQAQAAFLDAVGCQAMQGYLFARPMPLQDWLAAPAAQAGMRR